MAAGRRDQQGTASVGSAKGAADDVSEKTVLKSLGLSGGIYGAVPCGVDVKDGKVVRIRPLHFDQSYDPATFNAWKIEKNGKTFEPLHEGGACSLEPGLQEERLLAQPHQVPPQARRLGPRRGSGTRRTAGKSKYVRISWDEAAQLVADEVKRICDRYGPLAILVQGDGHGECKFIHAPHGCSTLLLDKLGGFTQQVRNPDSWEGWYWGSRHIWGKGLVGMMNPADNIVNDITQNSDMVVVWGGDPETTPWGFRGQLASRLLFFWNEIGLKQVYICPEVNYACAIHADKWIPILPNTDAALQLAIMYVWITEGTYDKEYVEDPHRGLRQDQGLRHGRRGRRAQDPAVGLAQVRRAGVDHQGSGPRLGQEDGHHRPLLRRRHGPRPVLPRAGPVWRSFCWACRAWASRACISRR